MISNYLDTKQLEAFVAVISTGSMTGAARSLGKSQPVITRLVQDLEQELGFSLLHRNGPRIAPTEQGVAFFEQAELFLSGLRTISERARQVSDYRAKSIQIAAVPAIAAGILPHAIGMLREEALPNHIHLQSIASENVVQAVAARTADLGIASLPLDNSGVDIHWVGEVPCVAVVSANDQLAGRMIVRPEDLRTRRLISSANPYRLRMRIDQSLRENGLAVESVVDSNATFVSLSLARMGMGVAIVESATLWGLPVQGVAVIPLDFHVPFYWGVITATGRPLSPTIHSLIHSLEQCASIIPGFVRHSDATGLP